MCRTRSSVKFSILLLSVITLFCSCTKVSDNAKKTADSVSFCDALGRAVSVEKGTYRAACLTGSFADVWTLSGGQVCACADDAFDDFGLEKDGVTNLGKTKNPDLEILISSAPELVIASADTAANVEMCDILEDMNLNVIYFDVDSFDDYLYMLDICTDITGRKDLFQKNGLDVKESIEKTKEKFSLKNIPEEEKTYLFFRASAGYIRAKGSYGTVLGEMLSELGFINIADSDTTLLENLSIESIMKADPYRIFIVQVGDNDKAVAENIKKMMEEAPAWHSLSAVKEDRLFHMDKRLFNLKPNALWGIAYETLCKTLAQ